MGNTNFKSEKKLSIVLVGLCVIIVGLFVAIVIIMSTTMGKDYREVGEGMIDCGKLDEFNNSADVSNCLATLYEDDGEEKTLAEYKRRIDTAFENEDYDLFYGLILGRASFYYYILEKDCDVVTSSLDDDRVSVMSPLQRLDYYQAAMDFCSECKDETRRDYYQKKIDQLSSEENIDELFEGGYE